MSIINGESAVDGANVVTAAIELARHWFWKNIDKPLKTIKIILRGFTGVDNVSYKCRRKTKSFSDGLSDGGYVTQLRFPFIEKRYPRSGDGYVVPRSSVFTLWARRKRAQSPQPDGGLE